MAIKRPSRLKGEAAKEWKRLSPSLEAKGMLTDIDSETFACYCELHAEYLACLALTTQPGFQRICTSGKNGAPYTNPLISMMNKSLELRLKYAKRFGLDPESRGQAMNAEPVKQQSGLIDS